MKPLHVFGTITLAITLVTICFAAFHIPRNQQFLSFTRTFAKHVAVLDTSIHLSGKDYAFAGASGTTLYLSSPSDPLAVHEIDLTDVRTKTWKITHDSEGFMNPKLRIDSPHVFLHDGNLPIILAGKLVDKHPKPLRKDVFFLKSVPLPGGATAATAMVRGEQVLVKIPKSGAPTIFGSLLEKQVDGFFCKEGNLSYDPISKLLVYVYQYRNQYMVLDTSFLKLSSANTIDPIAFAKIASDTLEDMTLVLKGGSLLVNKVSCGYGGLLYNVSNIRSVNQTSAVFNDNCVIDVYDLYTATYKHSFHVPKFDRSGISGIQLTDDRTLWAIQGGRLSKFSLH